MHADILQQIVYYSSKLLDYIEYLGKVINKG